MAIEDAVESSNSYNTNIELNMEQFKIKADDNEDHKETQSAEKNLEHFVESKDPEHQQVKYPYPKAVPFIISNEFCERFNYYGLRTILVIYLTRQLGYNDDDATVIYHVFTMFVYFLCVFGAILSDSWLGKFKTILYLSMVYVCGSILMTLGAVPTLNLSPTVFTMIGLALIALGSGGIKPCVSAFGGDQFKMPEQIKQMTTFFSIFYFAINAGSLISTTVTPILREDVSCFGERECYSLAFGVPAILMIVSIVIFVLGRPLYKTKPPAGNMALLVSKTIGTAISTKFRERKTYPREHWLDYADQKVDKKLIEDVKVLMRVLLLFLPLPIFWALFDQQGSRWTLQATRLNGDFGSFNIKPDQLQLLNPLLILVFIPLYEIALYPLLNLIGIRRPLQKLTIGGILAGISFLISAGLELQLETTYPVLPGPNNAQIRIFNSEPCDYIFNTNIPGLNSFTVPKEGYYVNKDINFNTAEFLLTYSVTSSAQGCNAKSNGSKSLSAAKAYGFFLGTQVWYEDDVDKPSRDSTARTLSNVHPVEWKKDNYIEYTSSANLNELAFFGRGEYDILVNKVKVGTVDIKSGGVYTVMIYPTTTNTYSIKTFTITEPNSINILWLIPQYVVMTLAEVMFSVTGLEFSYAQAPESMKSVLAACWQLTVAFGNVIVVIVAELKLFDSQASEFFLFAGLMFADMLIFMVLAYYYKSNNPNENIADEPSSEDQTIATTVENKDQNN